MNDKKLRIGFMGTPDFALEALKAIHKTDHELVCVYSQPPRPRGRGHKLQPSPVQAYAQSNNIPVFHPVSLKSKDVQAEFAAHNLDVAVVAAYGLLLPKAVLDAPAYGCINIHASLLPRWRGASPIQRAIWEGDAQSGVALMQMDEGLDTGPVIDMHALDLAADETAATLHDRLAALGAQMIVAALDKLAKNGQLTVKGQENDGATYAHMLRKDDGLVNWQQTAVQIDRQIRALNPWPGVWCEAGDLRLKILRASIAKASEKETNQPVGILLDKAGHIQCGQGSVLKIETLQPAGKQAMDIAAAVNGHYLKPGDMLT